ERLVAVVAVVHRSTERWAFRMLALGVRRPTVRAFCPLVLSGGFDARIGESVHQMLNPNSRRSSFPCSVTISTDHSGDQTGRNSDSSIPSTCAALFRTVSLSMSRAGHPV